MPFTEDLDSFLADFGHASTLQGGVAGAVVAIYDAAWLEQFGVNGTSPTALCRASVVVAGDVGKTLTDTVTAVVYTIRDRQPIDDGAFVLLQLST
jgi:hypothetical protein